jgi:alginate O-acetyltransferase complex protein AlgI
MSFVSPEFALLCLLFFPVYWQLADWPRIQRGLLVLSGYAVYASWSLPFAGWLLVYSVCIWGLGYWVAQSPERRLPAVLALVLCTGFLVFFKYYEFLRTSLAAALGLLGFGASLPILDVVAPVGVSFFTFQAVTYLVMAAKQPGAVRSLPDLLLFLCFWPTLFAGPILRADRFFAQLDAGTTGRPQQAGLALYGILLGAAQKLIFATWLADTFVDPVFKYPQNHGGLELLAAIVGYTLQIFLDFGGYTLIVTGLGLLLGFELPVNFRQPYLARNLQDFWTRWHVSLSSFIRDFIYIPMGGNRLGFVRTQWNVLFGMLVSGVWHGPSWTFVIWGGLHGLGVVAVNLYKRAHGPVLPAWLAQTLTLCFVAVAWVFFRADTWPGALDMLHGVWHNELGFWPAHGSQVTALGLLTIVFLWLSRHALWWQSRVVTWMSALPLWAVTWVLAGAVFAVVALGPNGVPGFIYYRF